MAPLDRGLVRLVQRHVSLVVRSRWSILATLFAVRATMAFQFQSVAAVAPLLRSEFHIGLADIGLLIGVYLAPGAVLALPGGAIGQRFGDKPAVLAGTLVMLVGGLTMTLVASWPGQVCGRLIAGIGGVLLNVLMTKMVVDWFAGKEISTAMAIFINSWPAGLAISLLVLPPIGDLYGVSAVYTTVMLLVTGGTILLAMAYQPSAAEAPPTKMWVNLDRSTVISVIFAALIWSFYNVGFAMIFSFGPSMLVERGWSIAPAGSITSIVLWLAAVFGPLGGVVADRTKRPGLVLVAGWLVFAMLLVLVSRREPIVPIIVALGIVSALPSGPIMSLPARVLGPEMRSVGMGLFYTIFYCGMMLGPVLGGSYASWAGTAGAALDFGAAMLLTCPILLWAFHRLQPVSRSTSLPRQADP
jgi:MFS family permease